VQGKVKAAALADVATVANGFPIGARIEHRGTFIDYTPYKARFFQSAAQSIPTGVLVYTTITNVTANYDPNSSVTPATGTWRAPFPGKYHVSAGVTIVAGAAGWMSSFILVNGLLASSGGVIPSNPNLGGTGTSVVSDDLDLLSNQAVTLAVLQNSGGIINTSPGSGAVYLAVHFLSR
jgi:hypothetical protein